METIKLEIKVPVELENKRFAVLKGSLKRGARCPIGELYSLECLGPFTWLAVFRPTEKAARKV